MNGSDRVRYQFQINVFNRLVTVCMSADFADVLFELINMDKAALKRLEDLSAAIECMGDDKALFDSDSQDHFVYLHYLVGVYMEVEGVRKFQSSGLSILILTLLK